MTKFYEPAWRLGGNKFLFAPTRGRSMAKIFFFLLFMAINLVSPVCGAEGEIKRMENAPNMVVKEEPQADAIVRLSQIEVDPAWLDEYIKFATEVGEISLRDEPGVLTMYAVAEKDNPQRITILETYASEEAYKKHIASPWFQKYKKGTAKMVKSLRLVDQKPLNPRNKLDNYITGE